MSKREYLHTAYIIVYKQIKRDAKLEIPNSRRCVTDSNGTSLVTQMNIKAAVSLSHPLSSCYNKNTVTKTESLLWMENQPGLCMSGNQTNQSIKEKSNSEYDKVAQQLPEYAEVTSSRVNANEWNTSKTATSPAAYASVTLVANTRQCVSSLVSVQLYYVLNFAKLKLRQLKILRIPFNLCT